MLDVLNDGWRPTGIQVILLHAVVTTHGEECSSRAVVANGGNIIHRGDTLIGDPLGAHIPSGGLTIGDEWSAWVR
jgi:hypothetical protein